MHKTRSSHLLPLPTDIEETHVALSAVQVQTRSTKPTSLFSQPIHLENGLLKVVVPPALTGAFILLAQCNTSRNVDTCGILAGRNVSILLTTLGRYATVASVGTFCFSPMVQGIT